MFLLVSTELMAVLNYWKLGSSYTKRIEQKTEYDVSTSSKSTSTTTQEKESEESAINVSSVSTPSTQSASSSTSASKIDFSFYSLHGYEC